MRNLRKLFLAFSALAVGLQVLGCKDGFQSYQPADLKTSSQELQFEEYCRAPMFQKGFLNYQIGDQWDKDCLLSQQLFKSTIFYGGSTFDSKYGQFTYLGMFSGKYIFITAKHVLSSKVDECDNAVVLFDENNKTLLECEAFIYSFDKSDISLLAFRPKNNQLVDLNPVQISTTLPKPSTQVYLKSRDTDAGHILIDKSKDCQILDSNPQERLDIDSSADYVDAQKIESWSLPVGCDARHGDSGAPLFSSNNELIGILWTGKYPKTHLPSQQIRELLASEDPKVWTEFNYIVPMDRVFQEMHDILENGNSLTTVSEQVLESLLQHYSEL